MLTELEISEPNQIEGESTIGIGSTEAVLKPMEGEETPRTEAMVFRTTDDRHSFGSKSPRKIEMRLMEPTQGNASLQIVSKLADIDSLKSIT